MAFETGVKESYAKEVYFKTYANHDLFIQEVTDPITGTVVNCYRSTADLTIDEMTRAINNFRHWAEENGYYLPEATLDDDEKLIFKSPKDEQAFNQAAIETARASQFLD